MAVAAEAAEAAAGSAVVRAVAVDSAGRSWWRRLEPRSAGRAGRSGRHGSDGPDRDAEIVGNPIGREALLERAGVRDDLVLARGAGRARRDASSPGARTR